MPINLFGPSKGGGAKAPQRTTLKESFSRETQTKRYLLSCTFAEQYRALSRVAMLAGQKNDNANDKLRMINKCASPNRGNANCVRTH